MNGGAGEQVTVRTSAVEQLVDVTAEVNDALRGLGMTEGVVLLYCPHTTAALTVNESADPDVYDDISRGLSAMVPNMRFRHAEGNASAHLRAAMLGPSLLLPVQGGRLELGTWQGVFFCEFDGPRSRQLWVRPVSTVSGAG